MDEGGACDMRVWIDGDFILKPVKSRKNGAVENRSRGLRRKKKVRSWYMAARGVPTSEFAFTVVRFSSLVAV
jgi:hypothetical protein